MTKEEVNVQHWLTQYMEAYDKLCQYFGCDIVPPPEIMLDQYWCIAPGNQSIYYDNHKVDNLDDMTYAYDIRGMWGKELYTLVFVQNCSGEKFMTVWSNYRRIK
jgi:hypothetical protein